MFVPKHAHPFTVDEALALDPPTLTGEIARLRNSLVHLRSSNAALLAFLSSDGADAELEASVREKEGTIAAQEERIALLQACLAHHVGPAQPGQLGHYDLPADLVQFSPAPASSAAPARAGEGAAAVAGASTTAGRLSHASDDDGRPTPAEPPTNASAARPSPSPHPATASSPPQPAGPPDADEGVHL